MKQALATAQAPAAIGPYSQGIAAGQTVYVSGQLPIDPATVEKVLAVTADADMNDFAEMNKVYGEYFAQPFPARSAVQVAKLPKGAPLEIECIAVK